MALSCIHCLFQVKPEGLGVVGVVEANFLDPTHDKQDFNRTDGRYRTFMDNMGKKLKEYWAEKTDQPIDVDE